MLVVSNVRRYDRAKCAWRYILDTQLICAMAPPGGARAVISARTQSRFNVLNLTTPSDSQVCYSRSCKCCRVRNRLIGLSSQYQLATPTRHLLLFEAVVTCTTIKSKKTILGSRFVSIARCLNVEIHVFDVNYCDNQVVPHAFLFFFSAHSATLSMLSHEAR